MQVRTWIVVACSFVLGCGGDKTSREQTEGHPSYDIRKSSIPITVDGQAEKEWEKAPWSPSFVSGKRGPQQPGDAKAKLLWDDQFLYGLIQVKDSEVSSPVFERDGPLWKHDVVELFIDADGNGQGYLELQVNPNNTQLDYWFYTRRGGRVGKAYDAKMKSAVAVDGTLNGGGSDKGWTVEFSLPLEKAYGPGGKGAVVPGASWNLNVVRVDKGRQFTVSSWSQIPYSDFHALHRLFPAKFVE